jgi:hypothetical protein
MKLTLLFPVLLVFVLAVPAHGREPIDPLLQAASKALDHYQQLAPGIHCEDATTKELSDACKIALETLKSRVQEANAEIARYRRLSNPQVVDLFDTYQAFRRVMDGVDSLNCAPDFYGEHNKQLFAEAYNTFVKITGWFGGVVRDTIEDAVKCSEHRSWFLLA